MCLFTITLLLKIRIKNLVLDLDLKLHLKKTRLSNGLSQTCSIPSISKMYGFFVAANEWFNVLLQFEKECGLIILRSNVRLLENRLSTLKSLSEPLDTRNIA